MIFLKVPFAEKDEAKALGARWNGARKAWYVPDGQSTAPFERWLAPGKDALAPARVDAGGGKVAVGANYFVLEHDCNPFEACATCRPVLESSGWASAWLAGLQMLGAEK
ncbi:MAG: DUF5710 domain-containing protein [Pseudomonadota bacterium]